MTEYTFEKEKLAFNARVSELMINEIKLAIGRNGHDFINETLTVQLEAFIMSSLNETKTITVYRERPTFLEWLFRKPRTFTFVFNAREVLRNPPKLPSGKSVMIYTVHEDDENN